MAAMQRGKEPPRLTLAMEGGPHPPTRRSTPHRGAKMKAGFGNLKWHGNATMRAGWAARA
jgi:hypothetical protein